MDPAVWGPITWDVLFAVARDAPRSECIALFEHIRYLLPCPHCKKSYASYIERIPPASSITDDDQHNAIRWLWTVKDMVNQHLGKQFLSFGVLKQRCITRTTYCSEWDAIDMCIMFALCVDTDDGARALAQCIPIIRSVVQTKSAAAVHIVNAPEEAISPATLWRHFLDCKITMLKYHDLPMQSRDDLKTQYDLARTPTTTNTTEVKHKSKRSRRRLTFR